MGLKNSATSSRKQFRLKVATALLEAGKKQKHVIFDTREGWEQCSLVEKQLTCPVAKTPIFVEDEGPNFGHGQIEANSDHLVRVQKLGEHTNFCVGAQDELEICSQFVTVDGEEEGESDGDIIEEDDTLDLTDGDGKSKSKKTSLTKKNSTRLYNGKPVLARNSNAASRADSEDQKNKKKKKVKK